jgi:hypothetical protein
MIHKKCLKGSKMKRNMLVLVAVSLLLLVTLLSATQANAAQTGQWITHYTIADLGTGQVLYDSSSPSTALPILAGAELGISITVNVAVSNPTTALKLSTSLNHAVTQGTYWQLQGTYEGLSGFTYNPNQNYVQFNETVGTLQIYCFGIIPSGITVQGGLDRKVAATLVSLTDPTNAELDAVSVQVTDAKINSFDALATAAFTKLQELNDSGIDPAYLTLYQTVVAGAVSQASAGFVDNGITVLQQLASAEQSYSPSSIGTPFEATLFYPAVIALVVVVVVVGFLMVRARGRVSYDKLVIEDQIKDLEGLSLRASRIDKNLTVSLESVKDRLKSLVEVE